jgi:hypothetical protein
MGISLDQKESDIRLNGDIAEDRPVQMSPEDLDFIRSIKVRWDSPQP